MTPEVDVLLLGASGFLGRNLRRTGLGAECRLVPILGRATVAKGEVEFKNWKEHLSDLQKKGRRVAVVNCVAIAELAACVADPAAARKANVEVAVDAARYCKEGNTTFVHISTDGLFPNEAPGEPPRYWSLQSAPAPVNEYGRTKLDAETALRDLGWGHVIRMSFVGPSEGTGRGLIAFLARQLKQPDRSVPGFADNWFSPVHVDAFAKRLGSLLAATNGGYSIRQWGSYPALTKYDYLERVARVAGFAPRMVVRKRGSEGAPLDQSLDCEDPWRTDEMVALSATSLKQELGAR